MANELYDKPKQILVEGSTDLVTAHQKSDNMIELKRLDQKIIITGSDFSVMATSPKHVGGKYVYTTITATDGKIDSGDLNYREDKQPPEGKQYKLNDKGEKELDDNGEPILEDKPAEE
jgi:hypothetical protein